MHAGRLIPVVLLLSLAGASRAAESTTPLTLEELLRAALAYDGRVLAAAAELDAYRARYDEASRSWFPKIVLEAAFGGPVSEFRLDRTKCGDPPEQDCVWVTPGSKHGTYDFSNMSFAVGGKIEGVLPLYTFGKLSGAKDAANAGVQAGEAGVARARQDVALEVRRAYYGWLLATSAVDILADGQSKIKEAEDKLVKMLDEDNEEVSDRDLFKLRYYASQVEAMMIQARQGQEISLAALRFLTGLEDLGTDLGQGLATMELIAEEAPTPNRAALIQRAIQIRPELRQLRAAHLASAALVGIQEASFYPDFFLTGYFKGSYSPAQEYIENSLLVSSLTNYGGGVALGMRITLDIPQKLAQLSRVRAEYSKVSAQLRQAEEAVGLEIDKRLSDLQAALANLKAMRKGQRAAKAWMNANMMDYGVGITNTRDLLDSLAAHAKSRMDMEKAGQDHLLALDQIKAASGEDLGHCP